MFWINIRTRFDDKFAYSEFIYTDTIDLVYDEIIKRYLDYFLKTTFTNLNFIDLWTNSDITTFDKNCDRCLAASHTGSICINHCPSLAGCISILQGHNSDTIKNALLLYIHGLEASGLIKIKKIQIY